MRGEQYKLIWSPLAAEGRADNGAQDYVSLETWKKCSFSQSEIKNLPENVQTIYQTWLNPPEYQLYDLQADEWEFHNLAELPEYFNIKINLISELKKWMIETRDYAMDSEKLMKLTAENDRVKQKGQGRWPIGGWNYSKYLFKEQ